MDRFVNRSAVPKTRVRPSQIGDKQRIVAASQEGI
jgi:hypothetical protein